MENKENKENLEVISKKEFFLLAAWKKFKEKHPNLT